MIGKLRLRASHKMESIEQFEIAFEWNLFLLIFENDWATLSFQD